MILLKIKNLSHGQLKINHKLATVANLWFIFNNLLKGVSICLAMGTECGGGEHIVLLGVLLLRF